MSSTGMNQKITLTDLENEEHHDNITEINDQEPALFGIKGP